MRAAAALPAALRMVVGFHTGALARRGFWGIADQALISATTFVTMVLLGRHLDPAAFGSFTLVYAVLLFANNLQLALITQPHNVIGATQTGEAYTRYTTATGVGQLAFTAVTVALTAVVALVAHLSASEAAPLLGSFVPAIAAWQLREFPRRVLYTEGRLGDAFANDLLGYGAQGPGMLLLGQFGHLSGETALILLASTSGVAALWGLWLIKPAVGWPVELGQLRDNWRYGKWLLGAMLASSSYYLLFPVLVAALVSVAELGAFRAVQTIMGPTHVLLKAMESSLTPRAAREHAEGGVPALGAFILRAAALTAPLMAVYCLLVALFAGPILRVSYGDQYSEFGWLLAALALTYGFVYLAVPVTIALQAAGMSAPLFRANLWSTLSASTLGTAAIAGLGLPGAALVSCLREVVLNAVLWRRYARLRGG